MPDNITNPTANLSPPTFNNSPFSSRNILTAVVGILVLALIATAGYFIYQKYFVNPGSKPAILPSDRIAVSATQSGSNTKPLTNIYLIGFDGKIDLDLSNDNKTMDVTPFYDFTHRLIYYSGSISTDTDKHAQVLLSTPDGLAPRTITFTPTNKYAPVVSDDGKTLAYISADDDNPVHSKVHLVDLTTLKDTPLNFSNYVSIITWIPQTHNLLVKSNMPQDLYWYQVTMAGVSTRVTVPDKATNAVYSLDGKQVAYIQNGQIYLTKLDGKDPQKITSEKGTFQYLSWNPDGSKLLTVYQEGTVLSSKVAIVDISSHAFSLITVGGLINFNNPVWVR